MRIDAEEVRQTLGLLRGEDQIFEVRALAARFEGDDWRDPAVIAGFFDSEDAAVRELARIMEAKGAYVTINPVAEDLLARSYNELKLAKHIPGGLTKDEDIERRRWMLVDIDPTRPSGVSATDEEHERALEAGRILSDELTEAGWPAPIIASSGNGAHLLYRIDLRSESELVERALEDVAQTAARIGLDGVEVDTGVGNPAQMAALYGTEKRKGSPVEKIGRVYRIARILSVPDPGDREILTASLLREAAPQEGPSKNGQRSTGNMGASDRKRSSSRSLDDFLEEWGLAGQVKGPVRAKGGGIRRDFEVCPCARELTDETQAVFERADGRKGFKCFHENSCPFETWRDLRAAYDPDYDPNVSRAGENGTPPQRVEPPAGTEHRANGREAAPFPGGSGGSSSGPGGDGPDGPRGGGPYTNGHAGGEGEEANWTYGTDQRGRIVRKTGNGPKTVMQGQAWIARAVRYKGEDLTYEIEGTSRSAGSFCCEITSEEMSDPRRLKAAIEKAMGPKDYVESGQKRHLGQAIRELTYRRNGHLEELRGARKAGWMDGRFLIPGRVPKGTVLDVDTDELPYAISGNGDLEEGLERLEDLITAIGPRRSTVVLSQILGAPLARRAGLRDDRYALFIKGQTGSLKTSWTQAAMSIYGPRFMSDETLLRWGQGATVNAMMYLAGQAQDLPFFVDNYKPNVGRGERGFVEMMHQILEGGEKKRLNRAAALKDSQNIRAWPVFTGEDLPQSDAASLARLLAIEFVPAEGMNEALLRVQRAPVAMNAIGGRWLEWLETEKAGEMAETAGERVTDYQETFAGMIRQRFPSCMNVMRLAMNLAVNRSLFETACQCPKIGAVLRPYLDAHREGIGDVITRMGEYATESLEAHRFLVAIADLLGTGKARLVGRREDIDHWKASDVIGYRDPMAQTIYLVPTIARKAVQMGAGEDLGNLSKRALYRQLDQIGALAETRTSKRTVQVRVGPDGQRCTALALRPDVLGFGGMGKEEEDGDQSDLPF